MTVASENPVHQHTRILVVEPEAEVRELLTFFIESEFSAKVMSVQNGLEAKSLLEKDTNFKIVISDHLIPELTGAKLLQFIRQTNLSIKFILLSESEPAMLPDFRTTKPDAFAQKPKFTDALRKAIETMLAELTPQGDNGAEALDPYVSIAIEHLYRTGTIPYPIFARLSDKKFVKILNENDIFGSEELERFRNKKISHLFIQRDHAKEFLKRQIEIYSTIAQSKELKTEERIVLGDEISSAVHDLASNFGFSEELEALTKTGVDLALKTISTSTSLMNLLKNLNLSSGNYLAIHSSRLPFMANQITKMMGWDSEGTSYKMALASMLHDSTLNHEIHSKFEHNPRLLTESGSKLNKKEHQDFVNHTINAAKIAVQFKGIPPDVDSIIAQHHENCEGSGFPYKMNYSRIAPLSTAFIVAHDLLCYYEDTGVTFSIEDFIALKQEEYFAGHFKKILQALETFKFK